MIDILVSAFFLSVILLGIHSYFGIEIIKRGIIFTDLAIGQMAALGAAVALRFFDGQYVYLVSLAFALSGGLAIAMVSRRAKNHEAFIGLMYALGISGVYLLLSTSAHGMEDIEKLLAADILFTPVKEVVKTSILYGILGIVIFYFHRKTTGTLREILFFITFSLTVTSSVKLAGVLVVFALLVGPALAASTISSSTNDKWQLGKAWIIGIIVNISAIALSYKFDLPTGYTIVFAHASIAMISFTFHIN
ncbi:MAG: metal ABC transporter permease [Spirochaetia bacterium]|nr:metal ABC transporter permease [Spirochaetia bacterium]